MLILVPHTPEGLHLFANGEVRSVAPYNDDRPRFRVKLLFGLFEADAAGPLAIYAIVLLFLLMGTGRWLSLW